MTLRYKKNERKRIELTFNVECVNEWQFELWDSTLRCMAEAMSLRSTHKENKMLYEITIYENNEPIRKTVCPR